MTFEILFVLLALLGMVIALVLLPEWKFIRRGRKNLCNIIRRIC